MRSIHDNLVKNLTDYPDDDAIVFCVNDEYVSITNKVLYKYVTQLVYYLKSKYNNKLIAIIGNNKYEWLLSFFASFGYIGDVLLIDKDYNKDDIDSILKNTKPSLIILDDDIDFMFKKFDVLKFSEINKIIKKDEIFYLNDEHKGNIYIPKLEDNEYKIMKINKNNIYTSIVELKRKWNICHEDSYFLFLPLSNVYSITSILNALYSSTKIVLEYNYNNIKNTLKVTKPTIFVGDSNEFDKVKKKVLKRKSLLIYFLIIIHKILENTICDISKILFRRIHTIFGNHYRFGIVYGRHFNFKTIKFFNNIGLPLYRVYGMIETSGPVALCYENNNKIKSVGKILSFNKVKIMNQNDKGIGEICIKGDNIIEECVPNNEEYFYKTNDYGYIKKGYLYIVDKNI